MTDLTANTATDLHGTPAHGHGSHGHDPLVAHHFDDAHQQHDATELGMWVFLAQEVLFFGGLFLAYLLYRFKFPVAFADGSKNLNKILGGVNTAVLLGSSLTMAIAVHHARHNAHKKLFMYLVATLVLGTTFLVVKGFEWTADYHEHIVPGQYFGYDYSEHLEKSEHKAAHEADPLLPQHVEMFMFLYFAMTGLHALHMVVGIAILGIVAAKAAMGKTTLRHANFVEMMGLYWHFVDIVWIFLFPFLYLIKA